MSSNNEGPTALRGPMVWFSGDPTTGDTAALQYDSDGIVVFQHGLIVARGTASALLPTLEVGTTVHHHPNGLIAPGFVDTHLHLPQIDVLGSYGEQLLDWLNRYTFPNEQRFADPAVCAEEASFFVQSLLAHGVTTSCVFASVHPQSADALFAEAERVQMRVLTGKVMMDRNAPAALCDTAMSAYDDSKRLIERWHGRGRARYVVTPRFAPTSTPAQLEAAGALMKEFPGVHLQSHVSENVKEVSWVSELFPHNTNYVDVYDHFGLLGKRSILAHGIHLTDSEWARLSETETALSHCPTSNLFLGSGLFDLRRARTGAHPVRVGLGSDIGGGTSLSPLQTMGEAYKVAHLRGDSHDAARLWWLHTAGAAQALDLEHHVGNLAPGLEADAIVLDWQHLPLISRRLSRSPDILDTLFFLAVCGDDRVQKETWLAGKRVWQRE